MDERAQHSLHRVVRIEDRPTRVVVTTTDIHLPKRIGRTVQRAYKGRLQLHYEEEACFVRASWIADESHGNKHNAEKNDVKI
jgi:hypothetical protein